MLRKRQSSSMESWSASEMPIQMGLNYSSRKDKGEEETRFLGQPGTFV